MNDGSEVDDEEPHPLAGAGQGLIAVKAAGLGGRPAARRRRQHRPAMFEAASRHHSAEQLRGARIGNARQRPVDERLMDVLGRNDRSDRIDEGFGHPFFSFYVDRAV